MRTLVDILNDLQASSNHILFLIDHNQPIPESDYTERRLLLAEFDAAQTKQDKLKFHIQMELSDGSWKTEYTTPHIDEAERGATAISKKYPGHSIRIIDSEGNEVFV